jgi:hypothetical protein
MFLVRLQANVFSSEERFKDLTEFVGLLRSPFPTGGGQSVLDSCFPRNGRFGMVSFSIPLEI